ncbi:Transcriptional regulator, TetR family [Euzebya pacifica]|uniref:Transcriptional regulator, TetR family n=1 Tax=Euzebya pacifica TaxID=1608957 RepID=A0A346XWP9_9ACTN|nr:TetR/AcrR family transcriptional regulator [Euzebya pacifica]AXV06646.1 Transcriptional regulator, TetR family [Euzebya pacifica]
MATNRTKPARRDLDARRDAIISAAAELFSRKGFRETTLDDIMGALGVSGAAYYYYYDKKEDVLEAILDHALARVEDRFDAVMSSDMSSGQRVAAVLRAHALVIANNAAAASVLFNEIARARPGYAKQIRSRMRAYTDRLVELYREGIQTGELVDEDPVLAVYCMLGQANWIAQWYPSMHQADPDRVADIVSASAFRSFAVRDMMHKG